MKSVTAIGLTFCIASTTALSACASQFANPYVGKDSVALEIDNGKPVNVVEMGDGRRSYQYYWGGEAVVVPGAGIAGRGTPGCLVNFIAEHRGTAWVVVDTKLPNRLLC